MHDLPEVTYKVMNTAQAETEVLGWVDPLGDDWDCSVVRCENGRPVQIIGGDGGEPEDQTLGRDWAWIAPALQAAYELGRDDALTGQSRRLVFTPFTPVLPGRATWVVGDGGAVVREVAADSWAYRILGERGAGWVTGNWPTREAAGRAALDAIREAAL